MIGQENGSEYADSENADEDADKTDFSFNDGKANAAQYISATDTDDTEEEVKADYSYEENGSEYTDTESTDESADKSDYSYKTGQQSTTDRTEQYTELPTEGTKEDAEAFYESHNVGGGAWVDGEYDESAKADYSYMAGQQRGTSHYAQDTNGE